MTTDTLEQFLIGDASAPGTRGYEFLGSYACGRDHRSLYLYRGLRVVWNIADADAPRSRTTVARVRRALERVTGDYAFGWTAYRARGTWQRLNVDALLAAADALGPDPLDV